LAEISSAAGGPEPLSLDRPVQEQVLARLEIALGEFVSRPAQAANMAAFMAQRRPFVHSS
jgi:hypothetical protein